MDLVFLLAMPGVLWVQSWHLLGYYTNPRALGMVAALVAVLLLGVVLFQDQSRLPITPVYPDPATGASFLSLETAFSPFVLLWALYSGLIAGVYLWGLDTRTLGFYGLFLAVASVLFAVYFFLGGELLDGGKVNQVSWLLGAVAILLAVLAALLFFHLALVPAGRGEPVASVMRTVTGWCYLVFSVAVLVLGGLLLLGIAPNIDK